MDFDILNCKQINLISGNGLNIDAFKFKKIIYSKNKIIGNE